MEDNCQGIERVLRDGVPGEVYNIAGGTDLTNTQLTEMILRLCGADWDAVEYVPDRQANDIRYAMDCAKITERLGYRPRQALDEGLTQTAQWYRSNPSRWAPLLRNPRAPMAALTVPVTDATAAPR